MYRQAILKFFFAIVICSSSFAEVPNAKPKEVIAVPSANSIIETDTPAKTNKEKQKEKDQKIEKLMKILKVEKNFRKAQKTDNLPTEIMEAMPKEEYENMKIFLEEQAKVMNKMFKSTFMPEIKKIYAQKLTIEEIDGLLDFYAKFPKLADKLPELASDTTAIISRHYVSIYKKATEAAEKRMKK